MYLFLKYRQIKEISFTNVYNKHKILDFQSYYLDLFQFICTRNSQLTNLKQGHISKFTSLDSQKKYFLAQNNYITSTNLSHFFTKQNCILRSRRTKPCANDFESIAQIGQGAYGEIYLVKHGLSKKICALKVIPKRFTLHAYQRLSLLVERDILAMSNSPHLVQVMYSFQDDENLYMAMEYVPGGDFRTFLNSHPPLDIDSIQFFFAEMIISVGVLHSLGYIHRDVKPENFLITKEGHIKLSDFGLACGNMHADHNKNMPTKVLHELQNIPNEANDFHHVIGSSLYFLNPTKEIWAKEIVGSAEYMAVEILQKKFYNHTVDFWALGCILYEMLVGKTPFRGDYECILNWKRELAKKPFLPPGYGLKKSSKVFSHLKYRVMDSTSWGLVNKLITNSSMRYQTASDILHDNFFPQNNKINNLLNNPPFVPNLESELDRKYFDDFSSPVTQNLYRDVIIHRQIMEKKIAPKDKHELNSFGNSKRYLLFTFKKIR